MKKHLLLFISSIALAAGAQAQTPIPNEGFENWTNPTAANAQPVNWNSNKTGGGFATFGPQTCFRDTSSLNGGMYCVKVVTGSALGTVVNGSCTSGKVEAPTTTKADGYIHTIAGDTLHSIAFTGRPDSFVFWYKYSPRGTDSPTVQARLHVGNAYNPETPSNSNHPDSTVNIIARALWTGPGTAQATWQRVSIPFSYVDSRTPEYILLSMTGSADQTGGTDSTTLWVDEMKVIYNTVSAITTVAPTEAKISWHHDAIVADLTGQGLTGASLQLMTISGQVVVNQALNGNDVNIISTDVATGVYLYRIVSQQATISGKTIKQ